MGGACCWRGWSFAVITEEDEQTHADGQDGAGAQGGQAERLHLADLTQLAPEAIQAKALEVLG